MATGSKPERRAGEMVGGRYRLVELIGNGGMSVVWRAEDEVLDRTVAVKMLAQAGSDRFRSQLRSEARAYGRLNTPRIAQVYDYGETDAGAPYLVMEYVTGEPLSHRLADGGSLRWPAAVAVAAQIADALRAAHANGLVHRDVKPDNVLLTESGVKLVDFGICAMIGAPDADENGELLGTPAYLAPERIVDAPVQAAADVYGLGVLLYRALTGELPWPAGTSTGLLKAHMFRDPAPMPDIEGLPPEVERICAACMDKDPQARPSSAKLASTLRFATIGGSALMSPAPAFGATIVTPPSPASGASLGTPLVQPAAITGPTSPGALTPTEQTSAHDGRSLTWMLAAPHRMLADHESDGRLRRGRRRPYGFAAAIVAVSLALLGVAWGALGGHGTSSGGAYARGSPCLATFTVDKDWGEGFSGHVKVTNASDVVLHGWRVTFAFPGDQSITTAAVSATNSASEAAGSARSVTVTPTHGQPYAASIQQNGSSVSATTPPTRTLPVSQSVTVPISARNSGPNQIPTAIALNGTDCETQQSNATAQVPATKAPATKPPAQAGGGRW